jgi:phosphoglucosamine mutase
MAILAVSLKQRGMLAQNTLVATVMSNLGLRLAMEESGIAMIETKVGDRYVLEALNEKHLSLGGEQSGHVIMTAHATTGDGILTGLHLVAEMARTGKTLAELAAVMTVYPQIMVNVKDVDHESLSDDATIAAAVVVAQKRLGSEGRVLLRPSGTEPLVRVMVEASEQSVADEIAHELAEIVRERLSR